MVDVKLHQTIMSPSITSSISNFLGGIAGVVVSLFNSLFAVFTAILALGTDIIQSVLSVAQHVVTMVLDLFQGVFGFVAGMSDERRDRVVAPLITYLANIVAIVVLGGGYYLYTVYQQKNSRSRVGVKRT
jgi:phage-related protein